MTRKTKEKEDPLTDMVLSLGQDDVVLLASNFDLYAGGKVPPRICVRVEKSLDSIRQDLNKQYWKEVFED